jgi:hypothetical protein
LHYEESLSEDIIGDFLKKLERLCAVYWISGESSNTRNNIVYKLMRKMDENDVFDFLELPILNDNLTNDSRKAEIEATLNSENFYRKGRYKMPKYALMRLDLELCSNNHQSYNIYEMNDIQTEHILPQTPEDVYWTSRFDDAFTKKWKDRLGNLTILDGVKNRSARNKKYKDKMDTYLLKRSQFEITHRIATTYDEWTPENLQNRHDDLIDSITGIWID